jgi:SNF2 family DNA or RNA helicase
VNKILLELRAYQTEGAEFLASRKSALLADEMGLGKSAQVIEAIRGALRANSTVKCIIVAPAVLRIQWRDEFRKWAPEIAVELMPSKKADRIRSFYLPYPVTITSYEQVRSDRPEMSEIPYSIVVLDEAQKIKNPDSAVNRAVFDLQRDKSWILTATPIENSVSDVVSLTNFLEFGMLNEAMSLDEISEKLQLVMLRRSKEMVAPELPPIIDQTVSLELTGTQATRYFDVEAERYADQHEFQKFGGVLAAITELKKLCNYDDQSGTSTKLEALENIFENAQIGQQQLIVASQYVETLRFINDNSIFADAMHMYHGGMSDINKNSVLQKFNAANDFSILLLSLRAGAYGLNIPNADYVVLFDRWWNPAVETQAIGRAHRIGRSKPLQVFRFRVIDTVEDRIVELLARKSDLQSRVMKNDASDLESHISLAEMKLLLTPTRYRH